MSDEQPLYRYFAQPKVNSYLKSIIGYELLLKMYSPDGWVMPASFNQISSDIVASLLVEATEKLASKIGSVSVNLSSLQMTNPLIHDALLQAQINLRPVRLVIELIEETSNGVSIRDPQVLLAIKDFTNRGMGFSIDDVDTGQNTWPNIQPLLPYTTEIKYALQNRGEHLNDPTVRSRVTEWALRCQQRNLHFIIEGIEDPDDVAWADRLKLDLRQGYHYGKPHLIRLSSSDPD